MVSRKAKLAVEKVFFNTETNLPRPKIPVMNLLNLEKILQNPDTELKAQIQNQMREEQLKQAIEDTLSNYNEPESRLYLFNKGIVEALQNPNLLRHCDPEIMKQAGWVREEEYRKAVDGLKTVMKESDFPKSFAMAALIDLKEITPKR